MNNQQRKDWAKTLYLKEDVTVQKELAERVGVNPNTVGRWIKDEGWEKLRMNLLMTREEQLQNLYAELKELNEFIKDKKPGKRFADSKEADTRRKLIIDIKALETKASIVEMIETAKRFIQWVKKFDFEKAKELTVLFDGFIKDSLR
jgi:transcriptional regulator with XRE-family HTH domain